MMSTPATSAIEPTQLAVVWSLGLQSGSGGPNLHLYCSQLQLGRPTTSIPPSAFVAHALSSSHDTLLTVPRSLRRRIPGQSLQVWSAVRGLRLVSTGSASSWPRPARVLLTTLQASRDAADRPVARLLSETVFLRFDAECRRPWQLRWSTASASPTRCSCSIRGDPTSADLAQAAGRRSARRKDLRANWYWTFQVLRSIYRRSDYASCQP
jgi:hypothetical protein